jgi:hypothetical protein
MDWKPLMLLKQELTYNPKQTHKYEPPYINWKLFMLLKPSQLHAQELYLPGLDWLNMNNYNKIICIQTNNPPTCPAYHNDALKSINSSTLKMWQHEYENWLYNRHGWIFVLPKTTS